MRQATIYTIGTAHPTGYRDGEHEVQVTFRDGTRYVSGGGFGCSRDYDVPTDRQAIECLLHEWAMRLTSIVRLSPPEPFFVSEVFDSDNNHVGWGVFDGTSREFQSMHPTRDAAEKAAAGY